MGLDSISHIDSSMIDDDPSSGSFHAIETYSKTDGIAEEVKSILSHFPSNHERVDRIVDAVSASRTLDGAQINGIQSLMPNPKRALYISDSAEITRNFSFSLSLYELTKRMFGTTNPFLPVILLLIRWMNSWNRISKLESVNSQQGRGTFLLNMTISWGALILPPPR